MAAEPQRTIADVRRDIAAERISLANSVEELRAGVGEATDVASKLRAHLPIAVGAAAGAGFVLAGGIGATMRLLARRSREGRLKASLGRFSVVEHD